MGEGNDEGLWGDPPPTVAGSEGLPEEGVSERTGSLRSYPAGWGLSSGKKVRAEVTLPTNLRPCR